MVWNKGLTKFTHKSLMKTSLTMKSRCIDNFKVWRERMKREGKIPREYPQFQKNELLAEYIGVILGDGNISRFPRTQRLLIFSNSNNLGFINRYSRFTEILFNKKPTVKKVNHANMVRIGIYQKYISERLGVPSGNKKTFNFIAPNWVIRSKTCLVGLLRGLYEAEGSLSIHKPTYTYNFQFTNRNKYLLNFVQRSLTQLGFHTERRKDCINLRRKTEVEEFRNLIGFRVY